METTEYFLGPIYPGPILPHNVSKNGKNQGAPTEATEIAREFRRRSVLEENRNMDRKDEEIKEEIVDQLVWDSRVDASDVSVRVTKGVVSLEGSPTISSWSPLRTSRIRQWPRP